MHTLAKLHEGRHIYKPGGIGELEYDITPHLVAEENHETRDLPGFVLGNVTYESHHFWIHFCRYKQFREGSERKDSSVLIRVHHGAGWEVWSGDYMLAQALRRYGNDNIGAFLLCWYLIDSAKTNRQFGYENAKQEYTTAFVDGRLKKRKLPAQGKVKVWIEPSPSQPNADYPLPH